MDATNLCQTALVVFGAAVGSLSCGREAVKLVRHQRPLDVWLVAALAGVAAALAVSVVANVSAFVGRSGGW